MRVVRAFFITLMLIFCTGTISAQPKLAPKGSPLMCPQVQQLRKNKSLHWWASKTIYDPASARANVTLHVKWYSTEPSLAKTVDHFAGAQYAGSTEGHLACLYLPASTGNTISFPIVVYLEQMVERPKDSSWVVAKSDLGLLNCASNDPAQCSYFIYRPAQIDDPYNYLMKLRRAPDPT